MRRSNHQGTVGNYQQIQRGRKDITSITTRLQWIAVSVKTLTERINGGQKKTFFVFLLIRPTSLVLKELFFCILSVLTRLVRLISTKTKEYLHGRHLCIRSMGLCGCSHSRRLKNLVSVNLFGCLPKLTGRLTDDGHCEPHWEPRVLKSFLAQIYFKAALAKSECNEKSHESRTDVSTLLSSVFVKGDLKLLDDSFYTLTIKCLFSLISFFCHLSRLLFSNNQAASLSPVSRQYFTGNRDQNSIVQHRLFPRILARFVRVHPWGWYRHIAMRVEFYGCSQGTGIVINFFSFIIDDPRLCFIFCPMKMSWTHRVFPLYVVYFLLLISSFVVLTRIGWQKKQNNLETVVKCRCPRNWNLALIELTRFTFSPSRG